MHNNDDPQDLSSDNTPSQMNGDVSDSTPSQMNGNASDSTPSQMNGNTSDSTPSQMNGDVSDSTPSKIRGEETKQDDEHSENSQIPDSGLISDSGLIANSRLIEETAPIAEQPKADYQLLYTTAYHQIYSIVGEGRRYILKAIKPSAGDLRRQESLLKREYTLLSQLECPYIVRVWKLRDDPKVGPAIVMEYVDGLQLDKWLKTKPTKAQKQQILSELLEAIQYLHNKEIVHSDLKPQNILVAGNHMKLLDVGFSDKDEFTQSNIGYTPTYAAPEQIKGGTTDSRTDIYAIGALIRLLFPHDYRLVVRRCMRTNPQKRYASIADIQEAMQHKTLKWISIVALLVGVVGIIFMQHKNRGTEIAINTDSIVPQETTKDTIIPITTHPTNVAPHSNIANLNLQPTITQTAKRPIITLTTQPPTLTQAAKQPIKQPEKEVLTINETDLKSKTDYREHYITTAEPPVSYEELYDSLELCYNWRGHHYTKGKNPYYEFQEVWADFFEAEVRDITYHYLKQYPNKEDDVRQQIRTHFIYDYMQYRNLLTYYDKNTKRISDYPNDTVNQRKLKYLQDSLAVYSQYVNSFFSDADFVCFMPTIQKRREDDKRLAESNRKRKEMKQRVQEKVMNAQTNQPY